LGEEGRRLIRAVLDTNVLISALLFSGNLSSLVTLWKNQSFIPLLSKPTCKELVRVLAYPKFCLTHSEIQSLLFEHLLPFVEMVKVRHRSKSMRRDPSDNKFLDCAVSGKAPYLITGDKALLDLKEYQSVRIVTPAIFLVRLSSNSR
jgi:uncharacterized protein